MGAWFSSPVVYQEPVTTRYRANSLASWFLEVVGLLTVLVVPFIIGIAMGQFWLQNNVFVQMPEVRFSNKCLMRAQTFSGDVMLYGCSQAASRMLAGDPRRVEPFFSLLEDDRDGDGNTDIISFTFHLPLADPLDPVSRFEFLPAFQYSFRNYLLDVEMEVAPYILASSPVNDGSMNVVIDGQLNFAQSHPLHSSSWVRYDRVYNFSFFDSTIRDARGLENVAALATRYARRNESATFVASVVAFGAATEEDVDAADSFTVSITMRVSKAVVLYVPSYAELLKYAWVQYFAIAYVIHWAFSWIRAVLVKQALVNTIALYQNVETIWRIGKT